VSVRVAINGFGRMGRLLLRTAWGFDPARPGTLETPGGDWGTGAMSIVHVNDPGFDAATAAHLLAFDSVHGRWPVASRGEGDALAAGRERIGFSAQRSLQQVDWAAIGADLVIECSGKFRSRAALAPLLEAGVARVVVSAPVKEPDVLNVVMGVNDHLYRPDAHDIVTAASCTTNCLAPVVKVVHEAVGIRHGSITTVHDVTNTQVVVDAPHKDPRRARSALLNLIPTSTGSATAIGLIFPELEGRLDGIAVRVPLLNASLTDCVFEVSRPTSVEEVNRHLEQAAAGPLAGVLAFERRALVSSDFRGDAHSAIVDGPSTRVTGGTQVKILAWYDNEIGYVHRMWELAGKVARSLGGGA